MLFCRNVAGFLGWVLLAGFFLGFRLVELEAWGFFCLGCKDALGYLPLAVSSLPCFFLPYPSVLSVCFSGCFLEAEANTSWGCVSVCLEMSFFLKRIFQIRFLLRARQPYAKIR